MAKSLFTKGALIMILAILASCREQKLDCPLPETITYTKHIQKLTEEKCFMCHAQDVYKEKASRMKMYDYKTLKAAAAEGLLMGSITHAQGFIAMPYRKGKKIDTCAIAMFKKWVDTGMKE